MTFSKTGCRSDMEGPSILRVSPEGGSWFSAFGSADVTSLGPAKLYINFRKNSVIWCITCERSQILGIRKLLWGLLIFKHSD